ncbi:Cof-type HAD-IIB family hydrolase [Virgibacillus sp. FSP13]
MHQKIVFFDIDGTLLDEEKKIPMSTKKAIKQLKNNGVYVAIATGRAPFMFEDIRKELEIESFVSFNGQYVVFEGKPIYENPLGVQELTRLYQRSLASDFPMVFMSSNEMRASTGESSFIKESFGSLKFDYPAVDADYYRSNMIYQALLFCGKGEEDSIVNDHQELRFIRWHDYSCDVLPRGGSKAIGVQKLIDKSGIGLSNTFAFGDGLNDIEMLTEVGTGIAMGNGVSELKTVADYVTDDVDKNGIVKGLQQFGLL